MERVTAPDPHASRDPRAPQTRRALREARETAARTASAAPTRAVPLARPEPVEPAVPPVRPEPVEPAVPPVRPEPAEPAVPPAHPEPAVPPAHPEPAVPPAHPEPVEPPVRPEPVRPEPARPAHAAPRPAATGGAGRPLPPLRGVTARLVAGPWHPPIFKTHTRLHRVAPVPAPPLLDENELAARHARRGRRWQTSVALAAAAVVLIAGGGTAAALAFGTAADTPATMARHAVTSPVDPPEVSVEASAPQGAGSAASGATAGTDNDLGTPLSLPLCATPAFVQALAAGDDAAAIAAAGGADEFRDAVADGQAPCVRLNDPASVWVVVDKKRPLQPATYAPTPLSKPTGVQSVLGTPLRADAAAALSSMANAAAAAGVGEIALQSGYRSYATQQGTYRSEIDMFGAAKAAMVSARPGFSEHQTGLAADVVACTGGQCGTLDDLAATAQGKWLAAHAWQYGWIVRYESGQTPVTGYDAEPWHLRYIGTALAAAYHHGGYQSLEQFFGLPAAPGYAD